MSTQSGTDVVHILPSMACVKQDQGLWSHPHVQEAAMQRLTHADLARKLDLRINGRSYVGCPVYCDTTPSWLRANPNEHDHSTGSRNTSKQDHSDEHSPAATDSSIESESREASDGFGSGDNENESSSLNHSATSKPVPIQSSGRLPGKPKEGYERIPTEHQPSQSFESGISSVSAGSEGERRLNPLILFNVVAILACSSRKAQKQSDVFHEHIGKPFTKWLRQQQEGRGWVDRQIRKLEQVEAYDAGTGNPTSTSHVEISQPASSNYVSSIDRLLQDLFVGMKSGRNIHLDLGSHYRSLTLKIPVVSSSPFLPLNDPGVARAEPSVAVRSTSLSTCSRPTAPKIIKEGNAATLKTQTRPKIDYRSTLHELGVETTEPLAISAHATLVLLRDREQLISLLKFAAVSKVPDSTAAGNSDLTPIYGTALVEPMIYFISNLSHRRTLAQLTQPPRDQTATLSTSKSTPQATGAPVMPGLTLRDAQALACILVRLGVARSSLPLHASNTYAVSPSAPLAELPQHVAEWRLRFDYRDDNVETATLPEILQGVSDAENTFARPAFESGSEPPKTSSTISLQPWASLIPSKDLKSTYMDMLAWLVARNWVVQIRTFAIIKVSTEVKAAIRNTSSPTGNASAADQIAPTKGDEAFDPRPHRSLLSALVSKSRPASAAGSATSARTAVKTAGSIVSRKSSRDPLTRSSSPHADHELVTSLITDPSKADAEEEQWIGYIGEHLRDGDARQLWSVLVQYLDGRHALEEVAAMEGWKRAVLAGVVKNLVAEDVIKTIRHW